MNNTYELKKIGSVNLESGSFYIQLEENFISGLTNIDGFKYLQIIWWGHLFDSYKYRVFQDLFCRVYQLRS